MIRFITSTLQQGILFFFFVAEISFFATFNRNFAAFVPLRPYTVIPQSSPSTDYFRKIFMLFIIMPDSTIESISRAAYRLLFMMSVGMLAFQIHERVRRKKKIVKKRDEKV
jgi:hypothetical protein